MKRALLLTYYVPPRPGIASIRVGQLLRTLRRFSWEVVPVTPDLGDTIYERNVVTTGIIDFKEPMRRFLGRRRNTKPEARGERGTIEGWTDYANRTFGWVVPGSAAVQRMLAQQRFNAVISTSPPETTHVVAARVHGSIPWIADLRNPWLSEDGSNRTALKTIDRIVESRVLRSASAITTVSESLAESLRQRYPNIPVYCIPNAFSYTDWEEIPFVEPEKATFLHAGQLYGGRADPRAFFQAVSQLLRDRLVKPEEIQIDFYGERSEWLTAEVRRAGIASVVQMHGFRPRSDILQLERKASRLLLFLWNDPGERGTYTGKLFEYLGARRRILALGGPAKSLVDDVIEETGAGERYRTVAGIRDALAQAVVEWRTGRTAIVNQHSVAAYESEHLGRRFADILDEVASRPLVQR